MRQSTWLDRQRYRPQQWSSRERWRLHGVTGGETWLGFQGVCTGQGLARLRKLAHDHPEVQVSCSHDPVEFERLAGHAQGVAASGMRMATR